MLLHHHFTEQIVSLVQANQIFLMRIFLENINENIKNILFTHKGSYFLTNIGGEKDISNRGSRKLPLNLTQIKNTLSYLKTIKELNSNLIFIGPHIETN